MLTYNGNEVIAVHEKSAHDDSLVRSIFLHETDERGELEAARILDLFFTWHYDVKHITTIQGRHRLAVFNFVLVTQGPNNPTFEVSK